MPREIDVTDCAWRSDAQYDGATDGFAGIDRNAFYALVFPQAHLVGAHFRFRGQFPRARYFGFQTYDQATLPIDVLPDATMVPDRGSVNPFRGARWRAGHVFYTLDLLDVAPNRRPTPRPPNVLYGGYDKGGRSIANDDLEYRIYVPDRSITGPGIVPGDVPLPRVRYVIDDPQTAQYHSHDEVCRFRDAGVFRGVAAGDNLFRGLSPVLRQTGAGPSPAANPPGWIQAPAGTTYPYLNQETGYLLAFIDDVYGEVLALRFKAPSFPRTEAGEPLTNVRQVRYWSVCTIQTIDFTNTDACLRDAQLRPDGAGFVTVAVSTRRPNDDKARPFGWLPYPGGAPFLFIRQIVASPRTFPQSAAFPSGSGGVRAHLGPYYPGGTYCSMARFEADRCGLGRR